MAFLRGLFRFKDPGRQEIREPTAASSDRQPRMPATGPIRLDVPAPIRLAAAYAWRLLVVGLAVAALLYTIVYLHLVVLPIVAALFLATLLGPLVVRLRRRGWRPAAAASVVFVGALLVLAGLVGAFVPQVTREVSEMGAAVKQGSEQVLDFLSKGPLELSRQEIEGYVDRAAQQFEENRDRITSGLISAGVKVFEFLAGTLLMLVLLFFFLKDGPAMWGWFTGQFTEPARGHLREMGARVWATMGAYLRGVAIIGLIESVAIGIVLFVLGIPLLAPLMLLQFLAAFFPVVGPIVAGAVAALVALVGGGVADAAIVAIAILIIQQTDNHLLQPVIMGRAVKLHPVVVLVALGAGGIVGGVIGALIAVPVTAIASAIGNYINSLRSHEQPSFASLQDRAP